MKINFYTDNVRQTVKGYGASACWWSQNVSDEKTREEISRLLYGKSGLGLNIYRYNIGAGWDENNCRVTNPWRRCESFYVLNDNENEEDFDGEYDFGKDKNAYEFLKQSLKENTVDTVILFANSPHYSFTSSGQASGSLMHHTCNLPYSNYEKFADYFLDITQHFIDDGIPVNYISPINEPQWKWGGKSVWQEGCHYEPQEVAEVFRIFARKLEERNMDNIYLYGPESGEIGGLTGEYLKLFKADKLIMKHLGVFAVHSYHADNDVEIRREFYKKTVSRNERIRFDMSEWCELPCVHDTESIEGALITARIIGQDLCDMGAESWSAWVAVNQICDEKDGHDYSDGLLSATNGFSYYKICKRYYAMKHFTQFAPKGSRVLSESLTANGTNIFLFEMPDRSKSLIAVNEGGAIDIEVNGDFAFADIAVTDCDNDFKYEEKTVFSGKLTLSHNSITSMRLYGDKDGN